MSMTPLKNLNATISDSSLSFFPVCRVVSILRRTDQPDFAPRRKAGFAPGHAAK
jgi:hypothetical protein